MLSLLVTTTALETARDILKSDDVDMLGNVYTAVDGEGFYCLVINFEGGFYTWVFVGVMGTDGHQVEDDDVPANYRSIGDIILESNGVVV